VPVSLLFRACRASCHTPRGTSPTMPRKGRVSKLIAEEFRKVGIRVNCIAPGYSPSEMAMKESDEKNKSEMLKEKI
jgi:hypothetical protein